jgi:hypothetical protein
VMVQWGWNYFTRTRGAQLITGKAPSPLVELQTGADGDASPLAWGATAWARHEVGGRAQGCV